MRSPRTSPHSILPFRRAAHAPPVPAPAEPAAPAPAPPVDQAVPRVPATPLPPVAAAPPRPREPERERRRVSQPGYAPERRVRDAGGPEDHATYTCRCGAVFPATPTTSVSCPLCGVHQAW